MIEKMKKKSTIDLTQDALSHSRNLLLALSRAAQSIQRASTVEEVYHAVGDQIKSLGGEVCLFMVNDDRQSLTVVHTTYTSNLIRYLEKLLGNRVIGYRFELAPDSLYARDIATGKAVYVQMAKEYVAATLPKNFHLLIDQFMSALKIKQGIVAPLRVDDETLGLMIVNSLSLNEGDVPAMESFAGQIASSLKNIYLAQQIQAELFERKLTDSALHTSHERYRILFDSMMDGIYRSTHAGKFVDVNPAIVKMFGYSSREEMLTVDIKKDLYFSPEERASHILDIGQAKVDIYRMRRKDGSEIWVEDHGYYVHDGQGNILYHEGILRDITERKRTEEKSLLQSAALEAAANAIAITDNKGIIQWVNAAWVALTGYSKEESIGQNPRIIKSEKHGDDFYKNMWSIILAGEVWHGDVINRRKDGSLYHEEETITPVVDKQGNITNFIAIKQDVTKRKQGETDLEYAREELVKANLKLKSAFEHEQHLARTDVLTGINNRRYLFELAEHEFGVARRYQQPLSVIMFDLDHFKQINDTFGHATGDQMLESVTQTTRAQLRDTDLIGRYGGEEFVIILPVTSAQQAYLLGERIRTSVAALRVQAERSPATVTLSIGIAEMIHTPQDESVENVISRADEAMYAAKRAGRNRTVIFVGEK